MLATALLGLGGSVAAASAAAAADGDLQVRRTSPSGQAQVQLAVLPGTSDATGSDAAAAVGPVRVTQAGRRLQADTEPLVAPGHPLSVVVVVQPGELAAAQGLVADALATLPEDVRVSLAPVSGSTGSSSGPLTPSDALAGLDRVTAQPPASGLVASDAGASAGTLLVTSCPGGRLPDVGAATGWVLGWGADCTSDATRGPAGLVVERAATLERARSAVPGLMARVLAARSVRVTPPGPQPLTVTASGTRTTVLLTGGPAVGAAGAVDQAAGSAGGARGAAAAPAGAAATPTSSSVEARIVPLASALAVGAVGAAALAGAVLLVLRRRRAVARNAWEPTSAGDDPWSGLVPDWGRPREEDL